MEKTNTIDLGLPSGLLWADRNIGAESPEGAGLYFQWGDTVGYKKEQIGERKKGLREFDYYDYKFFVEGEDEFDCNMTKYNDTDGKQVLDLEDDMVHAMLGENWRTPTMDDFIELIQNTDLYIVLKSGEEIKGNYEVKNDPEWWIVLIKWETKPADDNVKGVKFYKKGDKSVYMFIPSVGRAYDYYLETVYGNTALWTSSLNTSDNGCGIGFNFESFDGSVAGQYRCTGLNVRGVLDKTMFNK